MALCLGLKTVVLSHAKYSCSGGLKLAGMGQDKYAGHSFRIGAATTARLDNQNVGQMGKFSLLAVCKDPTESARGYLQCSRFPLTTCIYLDTVGFVYYSDLVMYDIQFGLVCAGVGWSPPAQALLAPVLGWVEAPPSTTPPPHTNSLINVKGARRGRVPALPPTHTHSSAHVLYLLIYRGRAIRHAGHAGGAGEPGPWHGRSPPGALGPWRRPGSRSRSRSQGPRGHRCGGRGGGHAVNIVRFSIQ